MTDKIIRKHTQIKVSGRELQALVAINGALPYSVHMTHESGLYLCDIGNLINDAKEWALNDGALYPWQAGVVVALAECLRKEAGLC